MIPALQAQGAEVVAHDPAARSAAEAELPGVIWKDDPLDAVEDADALVILTEWNVYRGMNMKKILGEMSGNVMIDLRNVYEVNEMRELGFEYHCIGRT